MSTFSSKKLVVFDLDGTLAPSKSPIEPDMVLLLERLLAEKKVAVISGGWFKQFQTQIISGLGHSKSLNNLYLMPTTGTRMYVWKGDWVQEYAEDLSAKERERIIETFKYALKKAGYVQPEKVYGDLIEDRGSQITFSGVGQKAPLSIKEAWDPDRKKRAAIVSHMEPKLPEFNVKFGGTSSIDVTRRGIDKAYGIRRLETYLNVTPDEIVFVGDALYPGGNDYPARATGVDCIQVSGTQETKELIRFWLDSPTPSATITAENRKEVMTK